MPRRIHRRLGQDVLEFGRRTSGPVPHPVAVARLEDSPVTRVQADLLAISFDSEPTVAGGHEVKSRIAVRLDSETPRGPEFRTTVDGAPDPDSAQGFADGVRLVELAEQFHGQPPLSGRDNSCGQM